MSTTFEYTCELIRRASVTPEDAGCQAFMIEKLEALGFEITPLPFEDVENFWAVYKGCNDANAPTLVFAGHTDVVPTGDLKAWTYPPFEPTVVDGMLYGRGTADMKGSLAAMLTACEGFISDNPSFNGNIAYLITSDEEGPAVNGTVKVVDWLIDNQHKVDYCIVGEPSSTSKLGDIIKNGRRGSLNGVLTIHGKQGHIAYPHLADNPIHLSAPILEQLVNLTWDKGNDYFPPTSFQISNIQSGTGATNVIPGDCIITFNFRYSTEVTADALRAKIHALLDDAGIKYSIDWNHSGEPFLTPTGELTDACSEAISALQGYDTELSTSGGTSDGRFIAKTGCQIVELGPLNKTIHQIDECVDIESLNQLGLIYQRILGNLLLT